MINEITTAQADLIPVYREKWRQIALSTQPIDRHKAAESILNAYAFAGIKPPEIVFCDSPYAAFSYVSQKEETESGELLSRLGNSVKQRLATQVFTQLNSQIISQLTEEFMGELRRMNKPEEEQILCNLPAMYFDLWNEFEQQSGVEEWQLKDSGFDLNPMEWASQQGGFLDYCISVLNCDYDQTRWQIFQTLVQECGWILPDQKVCLVCDHPTDISFDGHCPVYEAGEIVVNFADGFSIEGICSGSPSLENLQLTIPIVTNWSEFNVSELDDNSARLLPHLRHELNPEQEALLPVYRQKWRDIMFKMGTVNRQQAIEAIQLAYTAIDLPLPTIIFCNNPQSALSDYVSKWNQEQYGEVLFRRFDRLIWSDLENVIQSQISFELHKELADKLNRSLTSLYFESGTCELSSWLGREFDTVDLGWYINPSWWASAGAYIDFCLTILGCTHDAKKWEAFRSLAQHCGWIFPYTKVCYVCDRPVSFIVPTDNDDYYLSDFCGVLIEFADGFSLSTTPEQLYSSSLPYGNI
jgi:hypothetical protein